MALIYNQELGRRHTISTLRERRERERSLLSINPIIDKDDGKAALIHCSHDGCD
jgi:hypothetical protein